MKKLWLKGLFLQIFLAVYQGHAEPRKASEFLVVPGKIGNTEFTRLIVETGTVEPGIYLAAPDSEIIARRDLLELVEGIVIDQPDPKQKPLVVGHPPGTIPNTRNELWAKYNGRYFLLCDQNGVNQRIAKQVPSLLVPAEHGAFLVDANGKISFVDTQAKDPSDPVPSFREFKNLPSFDSYDRHYLSANYKNLIYFSEAKSGSVKVVLLDTYGIEKTLLEVPLNLSSNGSERYEVSVTREGLLYRSSSNELSLLPLNEKGEVSGAAHVIFKALPKQTLIFKQNTPMLQANPVSGGKAYFYIRRDGSLSKLSVNKVKAASPTAEEEQLLKTHGSDWGRQQELGVYDEIISRDAELDRVLNALKGSSNTWVNILGPDGVGKSELLKLVAKRIAEERKEETNFWNSYLIYHIPMSTLVALKSIELPPETPPEEHPLRKLMAAITGKSVVVLIDEFLDDPTLGATNAGKSMDLFLELFRAPVESGQIRIVTTSNSQLWDKLVDGNPQLTRLPYAVRLQEPSQELLESILKLQIKKLEKQYRLSFDERVIKIIQSSAAELYPELSEPKRSVKAAEDLARSKGQSDPTANVKQLSAQEVRSFFLKDVVNSASLEGLDPEKLRVFLEENLQGQPDAVNRIVDELSPLSLGVVNFEKPLAKMLFTGPTGVGKTHAALILAEFLGVPKVKIDMNFFSGFSPDAPQTREIKALVQRPFVLILDDIDKAGSKALGELRSVFESGIFAEGTPNELNLRNAIIVMTANYGTNVVLNNPEDTHEQLVAKVQAQLSSETSNKQPEIPPHVWSRIESSLVIFRPLTQETLTEIAKKFVKQTDEDIYDRFKIHVVVDDAFVESLVIKSFQRELGAVPVQEFLRNKLRIQVALHLSQLRAKDPERFAQVKEVYVTVNQSDSIRIIDNTDPRASSKVELP